MIAVWAAVVLPRSDPSSLCPMNAAADGARLEDLPDDDACAREAAIRSHGCAAHEVEPLLLCGSGSPEALR